MAKPDRDSQAVHRLPSGERAEAAVPPLAHGLLALIVFLAGAAIMIIEIFGLSVACTLLGNSAYTWTALIGRGARLPSSAGGYLGGWLSEKRSDFTLLGWLLAGSSVLTLFVPALHVIGCLPSFERAGLISGSAGDVGAAVPFARHSAGRGSRQHRCDFTALWVRTRTWVWRRARLLHVGVVG